MKVSLQSPLSLTVVVSWMDSRLSFDNLRENQELNVTIPSEMTEIWTTKLVFKNTKEEIKSIIDENAKVSLKRKTQGRKSDESSPENKLVYKMEFKCDFNMN